MNDNSGTAMRRRDAIRRLIVERPVRSQKELGKLLEARNVSATQPTLSRDIRELGLVKGPNGYVAPDAAAGGAPSAAGAPSIAHRRLQKVDRLVYEFALSVEVAGTLVVLRTPPADAQPLALAIDGAAPEGVVGTIAGDDTIFLATGSAEDAAAVARRFGQAIGAHAGAGPARFSARRRPSGSARRRA